ncbi:LOW QUALITY PROTEIN: uncharacterized protein LOC110835152 [Zootermopsis nevadensis]|uniref:LOW QUALITY PROTEIN: uncharacterized protein LOC110835152 n=1 Tax=Zootermopsis nevadensis TaxID=136037 RepID=UPI000B8EC04C|nr:LOW QUALITY PROTEIN: uncharacterized protein LOC110835152 [Zootermopsis nevadensis]
MHWKISGGHNETVRRNGRSSWGSQPASVWKSPKRRISGDLIEGTNSNESFPPSIFMMLKNHLDIIGRNEPIQRKARFWQSYVRALKGTDDMRAHDRVSSRPRGVFRPLLSDFPELSSGWPYSKSIYDEPIHAVDRISVPGYRYLPVSRETYGYSPRNLYPAPYGGRLCTTKKAWDDHLNRLADIDRQYPSKSPLIARHIAPLPERESYSAEPKDKVAYNYAGVPIYNRGGYTRRPLTELFKPSSFLPLSRLTSDPWWWAYPSLRPYTLPFSWHKSPFYLRDSYLSPVKRTYLWGQHPIRPFAHIY